jgi:hypothetical protein
VPRSTSLEDGCSLIHPDEAVIADDEITRLLQDNR